MSMGDLRREEFTADETDKADDSQQIEQIKGMNSL